MNPRKHIWIFSLFLCFIVMLFAKPAASFDTFTHDIGMLWTTLSNHGEFGDDSYMAPGPSCAWPRGSGNSYLYAGSIMLSGKFDDGAGKKISVLNERDGEYTPLDSIHVTAPGMRADQETFTSYWDVDQPWSSTGDDPLGLLIVEKTYAWKNALADDFIITEYKIINVGIDNSGNGLPDTQRDIYDLNFTLIMDADVSKMPTWSPEDRRVGGDDHANFNADQTFTISDASDSELNGTYENWEWVKLDPFMNRQLINDPSLLDSLNTIPLDSLMTFMWDGDDPRLTATQWGLDTNLVPDDYDLENLDDDSGNPGTDGRLCSPGFIGWRMLKSEPYLAPKSYITCTIHDAPRTDNVSWADYINSELFCNFTQAVDPQYAQWRDDQLTPEDYRTMTSYGSLDTLKSGDTLVVTIAYGVGAHKSKGGIYSLLELNKNMQMAQYIVDNDYALDLSTLSEQVLVQLLVHDELFEEDLGFGWSNEASDAYDSDFDILASGSAQTGSFDARFMNNDEAYLLDARYPPNGDVIEWNLVFCPSTGNDPITLEWDPAELAKTGSFFLTDTNANVLADLRVQNRYTKAGTDSSYLKIIYDPNEVSISINEAIEDFQLSQNYPNPFNPTTAISYHLTTYNKVELSIFDISGRKIQTLISEYQSAGYHKLNWDASAYSSGVYLYRLQAGKYVETKKMLLLK